MPYAIDYTNVDFKFIDFMNDNYMVITGGEGKGKTNLTKLILNHFERNIFENGIYFESVIKDILILLLKNKIYLDKIFIVF